jgi:DNA-binding MarR family transcriptional regulator
MRLLFEVMVCFKRSGREPPAELREKAQRANLGPRHGPPLLTLAFEDALSVSELAERIGLSLPTTSQLVGELSRAGLVDRAEDEHDRRRTIVRLSGDYRDVFQSLLRTQLAPIQRTLERLSPRTRAHFVEGMRVLSEESASAADVSEPPRRPRPARPPRPARARARSRRPARSS